MIFIVGIGKNESQYTCIILNFTAIHKYSNVCYVPLKYFINNVLHQINEQLAFQN